MADFYQTARLIPVRPNWSGNVEVEWSYKTDVFTSRDGGEFRQALREKPRHKMSFSLLETKDRARRFRSIMAAQARDLMAIPNFIRARALALAEYILTDEIPISAVEPWMRPGRPVAFITDSDYTVVQIASVAESILKLPLPIQLAPTSKIAPVIMGRSPVNLQVTKHTDEVITVNFNFDEDPTTAVDPIDALQEEIATYRGIPFFPIKPNWREPLLETFNRNVDVIDFDFGAIDVYAPNKDAVWSQKFSCLRKTAADTQAIEDFFFRRKGQRGVFYCPTFSSDLNLAGVLPGDTSILASGSEAYELFTDSNAYRNIAIAANGGYIPVGIARAELDLDGTASRLFLDAPLPPEVAGATKASWLFMCRFASDVLVVSWKSDQVAEFDINVISVYDAFYEITISGHRLLVGGDYVTILPDIERAPFIPLTIGGNSVLIDEDYAGDI